MGTFPFRHSMHVSPSRKRSFKLNCGNATRKSNGICRFQQPQKPAEPVKPPDYFENPDAAVDFRLKHAIEPLQQSAGLC
jgi:hypothetical protein